MTDILVIAGIVIGAAIFIYVLTSFLIALGFASKGKGKPDRTPGELGAGYEDASFKSADGITLRGWYIPGGGNNTIIAMHGGRAHRNDDGMQLLELCVDLSRRGYNVLTMDRRGCGYSECPPYRDRARMELDFAGAVEYVRERSGKEENIFLFGNSVGALAAFVYTHKYGDSEIQGIIADSAFERKIGIAKRLLDTGMKGFTWLAGGALFAGEKCFGMPNHDAVDIVGEIEVPILLIIGECDRIIPVEANREILRASANPRDEVVVVPGAGHSKTYRTDPSRVVESIASFIEKTVSPSPDETRQLPAAEY